MTDQPSMLDVYNRLPDDLKIIVHRFIHDERSLIAHLLFRDLSRQVYEFFLHDMRKLSNIHKLRAHILYVTRVFNSLIMLRIRTRKLSLTCASYHDMYYQHMTDPYDMRPMMQNALVEFTSTAELSMERYMRLPCTRPVQLDYVKLVICPAA
jgi:hypothetical protein